MYSRPGRKIFQQIWINLNFYIVRHPRTGELGEVSAKAAGRYELAKKQEGNSILFS